MALYPPAADDSFDIGEGPSRPDATIMETGHVPVTAYTSDERFELERELFGKLWLNVGRVEQVKNPGDWFVREIECRSVSAIIVRGKDGEVRAFHNICSHRGMKLAWDEKGRGGKFACPYHAWMYDSTGALTHIPDEACFRHVDKEESGLQPIHCDVWEGFIFVNLARTPAQTLREFLGPLGERLASAPFDQFTRSCTLSQEVVGNWKLGIEAASEGYHVQALHTKTVGGMLASKDNPHVNFLRFEPLGPHRNTSIPCNPDFRLPPGRLVQRFAQDNAQQMMVEGGANGNVGGTFLSHSAVNPLKSSVFANEQFNIFPNFSIHISLGGYWTTSYWPISRGRSRWRSTYYFRTPQSHAEEFAIQSAMALNRDIFGEDNSCFQKQQAMLESGGKSQHHVRRIRDHAAPPDRRDPGHRKPSRRTRRGNGDRGRVEGLIRRGNNAASVLAAVPSRRSTNLYQIDPRYRRSGAIGPVLCAGAQRRNFGDDIFITAHRPRGAAAGRSCSVTALNTDDLASIE